MKEFCTGCGSTSTIEEIRARNPRALSCCPERKMVKPLSAHALAELRNIIDKPEPAMGVNPGVVRKLLSEGMAQLVELPSPFPTHRGKNIAHLRGTPEGVHRRDLGK